MLEITSIAADLMKIFARRHYNSDRYDDTTAIELLKYLQTLAHAEKVPTPKLDQYLAGEYPPVHMGCHIATGITAVIARCPDWQGGYCGGLQNRPFEPLVDRFCHGAGRIQQIRSWFLCCHAGHQFCNLNGANDAQYFDDFCPV